MPRPRPPHLHHEETRHGEWVWYVREGHGRRIRLKAEYGSEAFWAEYRAALEGTPLPAKSPTTHTLAWGLDKYRHSSAWAVLAVPTRRARENIFKQVINTAGHEPLRQITSETIKAGRERRKETPHAANDFLKTMRGFFKWAADPDGGSILTVNPTIGVKLLKGKNKDGFHTWTEDEVARFEAYWPIGTRERLALYLCLYTGLARA